MNRVVAPIVLFVVAGLNVDTSQVVVQDVVPKLLQATVEISVKEKKDDSFSHVGTGWLYKNQSTIVTAKHVVSGYEASIKNPDGEEETKHTPYNSIRITFSDGQQIVIDTLKESKTYDVAVLTFDAKKIKKQREPLVFAARRPKIGSNLFSAGFPFDYGCLLLMGNVTGWYTEKEGVLAGEYLVTNAMFAPGNSGGPVVNEQCDVIGMVDWIDMRSASLSFAIPSDAIQKAIKE